MAEAFISYSHKDITFGKKLYKSLSENGLDIWIDSENIPITSEWWDEIKEGIEGSDNFIFIISPDSISSFICNLEIDYAIANNKRITTVFYRNPDWEDIDSLAKKIILSEFEKELLGEKKLKDILLSNLKKLQSINWYPFDSEDPYSDKANKLLETLRTDLEYVKQHTSILTQAKTWIKKDTNNSLLLQGNELDDALSWQDKSRGLIEPKPIEIQNRFIQASQTYREKIYRRNIILVSLALVISLILGSISFLQYMRANEQANLAKARQLAAEARYLSAEQFDLALLLSVEAIKLDDSIETRQSLFTVLSSKPIRGYIPTNNALVSEISPQGNLMAIVGNEGLNFYDTKTLEHLSGPFGRNIIGLSFSPDGKSIAYSSTDNNTIVIMDMASKETLMTLDGHRDAVFAIKFSPDGEKLITAGDDGGILWDLKTASKLYSFGTPNQGVFFQESPSGHSQRIWSLDFSPDGRLFASGADSRNDTSDQSSFNDILIVWDVETGNIVFRVPDSQMEGIKQLAFTEGHLVTGHFDGEVRVWEIDTFKKIAQRRSLEAEHYPIGSLAVKPNTNIIAIADATQISFWNFKSNEMVGTALTDHPDMVTNLSFSADSNILASTSVGTTILWDTSGYSTHLIIAPKQKQEHIRGIDIANGDRIISIGDNKIIVWDLESAQMIGAPYFYSGPMSLSVCPNGTDFIIGNEFGEIELFTILNSKIVRLETIGTFNRKMPVSNLVYSNDGSKLASITMDGEIIVWNATTYELLWQGFHKNEYESETLQETVFSPDDKVLFVAAPTTGGVSAWNINTGERLDSWYELNTGSSNTMVFPLRLRISNVTNQLAFLDGFQSYLYIWNIDTKEIQKKLSLEQNGLGLDISPNGKIIATGGLGGNITLWDISTGEKLIGLSHFQHNITHIVFSPNGDQLVLGTPDGYLYILDIDYQSWISAACQVANRNMTLSETQKFLNLDDVPNTCNELIFLDGEVGGEISLNHPIQATLQSGQMHSWEVNLDDTSTYAVLTVNSNMDGEIDIYSEQGVRLKSFNNLSNGRHEIINLKNLQNDFYRISIRDVNQYGGEYSLSLIPEEKIFPLFPETAEKRSIAPNDIQIWSLSPKDFVGVIDLVMENESSCNCKLSLYQITSNYMTNVFDNTESEETLVRQLALDKDSDYILVVEELSGRDGTYSLQARATITQGEIKADQPVEGSLSMPSETAWVFAAEEAYYDIAVQTEGVIKGNLLVYDSKGDLVGVGEYNKDGNMTVFKNFEANEEEYLIVVDGEGQTGSIDQYSLLVRETPYLFYDEFGEDRKANWVIKEGSYFSQDDMLIIENNFSATLKNDFGEKYALQHSSTLNFEGEKRVFLNIRVKEQDNFNYLAFNCSRFPSWDLSWECEWVKVVDGTIYPIDNSNLTIGMLSTSTIIVNQNVYQNLDDGNIIFEFTDDTFQAGDIGLNLNPSESIGAFEYFAVSSIP